MSNTDAVESRALGGHTRFSADSGGLTRTVVLVSQNPRADESGTLSGLTINTG